LSGECRDEHGRADEKVRDVVQRVDLKQAEKLRAVGRDESGTAGDEKSQYSDQQVHDSEHDAKQAVW
jgi:hypothetical protein